MDAALAEAVDDAPIAAFDSELEASLLVRRAYARFRRRLLHHGEPDEDSLYRRFRAIGTSIAVMIGSDAYRLMRLRDRLILRELQRRILAWLERANVGDARAGRELWSDIAMFAEMLSQVNRRQELVAHDGRCVSVALSCLAAWETCGPAELAPLVAPLVGLDDEIDRLIHSSLYAAAAWRRALHRVGKALGVPSEPTPQSASPDSPRAAAS